MEKHELISTRDEIRTEAQKIRHSSVGLSGEELRSASSTSRSEITSGETRARARVGRWMATPALTMPSRNREDTMTIHHPDLTGSSDN